jgi:hypothetical protein
MLSRSQSGSCVTGPARTRARFRSLSVMDRLTRELRLAERKRALTCRERFLELGKTRRERRRPEPNASEIRDLTAA